MSTPTDFTPAEVAAAGDHDLLIANGDCSPAARTGRSLDPGKIVFIRPNTSPAGIFGTLDHPGTGALETAHQGAVILDDAADFDRPTIDAIATAHQDQRVRLYRGGDTTPTSNKPAAFRLIVTAHGRNPRALPDALRGRLDITTETATEPTTDPEILHAARAAQAHRLAPHGVRTNAGIPGAVLVNQLHPSSSAVASLTRTRDLGGISLRGYFRTLTVAWTLADLAGHTSPTADDIEAAHTLASP